MIKRLVIHRFRGIREGILKDLGKINLLIGPNNSGKTAILEMLYLGGTSGRPVQLILDDVPAAEGENLAFQATTSERFDFLGLEPLPRLRKRHGNPERTHEIHATLTEEGGLAVNLQALLPEAPLRAFRLGSPSPEWSLKDKTRFSKEDLGTLAIFSLDKQSGLPASLIPPKFTETGIQPETSRWHYFWESSWIHRWRREKPIDYLMVWAEDGKLPDSERVLLFDFHTANEHFQKRFATEMYRTIPGWEKKIAKSLSKVFPKLKEVDVSIKPLWGDKWVGFIELPNRVPIEIDQFGDGARHAFKVLASLIALVESVNENRPGLFLWEDPELFMHPSSLNALLREVIRLVKNKPVQIFLSSQSNEVIAFLTDNMQKNFQDLRKQFRVFRLDLEEGRLYTARYRYENILTWLEEGMDARFWETNVLPISYQFSK